MDKMDMDGYLQIFYESIHYVFNKEMTYAI